MTSLEYLRPTTMEEAVGLLEKGIPLAGGTELTPLRNKLKAVIDLTELGLDSIRISDHSIEIGSTTKLQAILEQGNLPGVLSEACQLEAGWNLRNMATLGGAIKVSDGRSPLLSVLLAMNVTVHYEPDSKTMRLDEFLNVRGKPQIIRKVEFEKPKALLYEQVARAPRDFPVVCAAVSIDDGAEGEYRVGVALGGYGDRPLRLSEGELKGQQGVDLEKASQIASQAFAKAEDAWASAEYRSHVAGVLVKRLLAESQGS